jgi:hypothetical protein
LENLEGGGHFGNLGIDMRIIRKWILKKYVVRVWIAFKWFGIGPNINVVNKPSGSVKCGRFLGKLCDS